jgi:hypothetical protein
VCPARLLENDRFIAVIADSLLNFFYAKPFFDQGAARRRVVFGRRGSGSGTERSSRI